MQSIFVKNRLNKTAREEIIKALDQLLPSDHCFPKSLYRFEKFFDKRKHQKKYICLKCNVVNDSRNCTCCGAEKEKDFSISTTYDIRETVQTLVNSNLEGIFLFVNETNSKDLKSTINNRKRK